MTEQVKLAPQAMQTHMVVDGHTITLCFSPDYNPTLASLVKETLLDTLRKRRNLFLFEKLGAVYVDVDTLFQFCTWYGIITARLVHQLKTERGAPAWIIINLYRSIQN